jgi:TPR repeat protein
MYDKDQGVTKNYQKAIEWYQKAADQEYEDTQSQLHEMGK